MWCQTRRFKPALSLDAKVDTSIPPYTAKPVGKVAAHQYNARTFFDL